jgi:tetratricopeptide (TPR) repeat protein
LEQEGAWMKIFRVTAFLLLGITIGISGAILFGAIRLWLHHDNQAVSEKSSQKSGQLISDAELKERLELYSKRADDIERLLSLLIAISTLYALALGLNAFAQLKDSSTKIEKLTDSIRDNAEKTKEEILEIFPLFEGIDTQITATMNDLLNLLPLIDINQKSYDKLLPKEKEAVRYYEKSIAATELFNVRSFKEKRSGIFHGLGNFYALKYVGEGRINDETLDRCTFYLEKAIALDPNNVGALNDRGYVALRICKAENFDEALKFFELSRRVDQDQQRPLYNMAWIYHMRGDFLTSIKLASEALDKAKWQISKNKTRLSDIHYHRACSYARYEMIKPGQKTFDPVLKDLNEVLANDLTDWPTILKWLKKDTLQNNDLYEVVNSSQEAKDIFAKLLSH